MRWRDGMGLVLVGASVILGGCEREEPAAPPVTEPVEPGPVEPVQGTGGVEHDRRDLGEQAGEALNRVPRPDEEAPDALRGDDQPTPVTDEPV